MKKLYTLLVCLGAASSSFGQIDEVDLFKSFQDSSVRLAQSQEPQPAEGDDVSDSYPTDYMDPEDLDDMSQPLVEQEAVPAEPTDGEPAAGGYRGPQGDVTFEGNVPGITSGSSSHEGEIVDPVVSDVGVACGCGEAEIPPLDWGFQARSNATGSASGCCANQRSTGQCCTVPRCCHSARRPPCGPCCGNHRSSCHHACVPSCRNSCSGSMLRHIRSCR